MGNNSAYTSYEQIVVGLANEGLLTAKSACVVGLAFANIDTDHGGKEGLAVVRGPLKGLTADEACVAVCMPKRFQQIQELKEEEYAEAVYDAFSELSDKWDW